MRSADTDPEAERVQIGLLSNATAARRAALALSLTRTTMEMTHRALWEAHPSDDSDEHAVRFVAHCYGAALAEDLRRDLDVRRLRNE